MKRKVIAITLTAMMAAGMLAGCGSSDSSSSSTADTTKEASATEVDGSTDDDSTAAGGDFSGQISVISREDGSGTRGAFIELFGVEEKNDAGEKVDNTTVDAQITNNTSVMMSTVAGNQYAIGYISLGSLNDEVKALKIDGAEASAENVENGSYKVSRPFNIVTKDGLSADAQDFMDYILSTDGQQVVSDDGYIAIKDTKAYEGNCSGEKVVVAGSSSVTPLMEKLKEAYTKVNSNANIEVQQSDSTTGITSASDGLCDIGMASRDLKDEEKSSGLTATVIATDGIAVIVNKENPTDGLTSDQVKSIYVGDTTDWALSILPHLMTTAAKKNGVKNEIVILTATSGDTGKAAMAGFADVPGTRIIVFYPKNGVSPIQEKQMVTQKGKNTHVVAIHGNFDDAQTGVKKMFNDKELGKELADKGFQFSSANSINIGRLVP